MRLLRYVVDSVTSSVVEYTVYNLLHHAKTMTSVYIRTVADNDRSW